MMRLRVLLVEDNEDDAQLVLLQLRRAGYQVDYERVDTAAGMEAALAKPGWQAIVSDFRMPTFDARAALAMMQQKGLDLPFIIVSGTIGEETAVEAMRAGAHDYLLKGNLTRLAPAIERELREAAIRHEQKKLQEQLLLSDRLASVGMLAAGVAHEINNPLAAVMANLEFMSPLLQEVLDADLARDETSKRLLAERIRVLAEPLNDARESAERMRHIIRDIKLFSRVDEEEKGLVDLRRVFDSSLRMAQVELRHRAKVVKDYQEVPSVEGNEARISQVFLNLIINAAHAMPEGQVDRNELRLSTRRVGNMVVGEVRDTGSGIPPELRERIFDPFFTTKPKGQGTGLGLAICGRIVAALDGRIELESEVGKGTTFRVLLPASLAQPQPAVVAPTHVVPGRRGRVLVVDDEPIIGAALRRMLSDQHDVVYVRSSHEALAQTDAGARFDVILCDLMMPVMTGMELHDELHRRVPELAKRMIFVTGGAFTVRAREFLDQARGRTIEKPFDAATLKALLVNVLARAEPL